LPRTTVDLYRMGNATSARLDHVRPDDIAHFTSDGVVWVRAGTGGVSTFDATEKRRGRWWWLAAGYEDGPRLLVWNDHGGHWSWEPVHDMPLDDYRVELAAANLAFR
jgi:hypothetical protein